MSDLIISTRQGMNICSKETPAPPPSAPLGGGGIGNRGSNPWNFEWKHPDAIFSAWLVHGIEDATIYQCPHCGQSYSLER